MANEIYNKFFELVEKGNEQEIRDFLVDNLKQFPQEVQDGIIMAFFEEALEKKAAEGSISQLQQQGIEVNNVIEKLRKMLEQKLKLMEIKEGL